MQKLSPAHTPECSFSPAAESPRSKFDANHSMFRGPPRRLLKPAWQLRVDDKSQWGLSEYVIVHTILPPSPVILWIELSSNPKWLPLKFRYHDIQAPFRTRTSQSGHVHDHFFKYY